MAVNLYRFAAVSTIDTGDVRLGISSGHATSVIGQTSCGKGAITNIVTQRGGGYHRRPGHEHSSHPWGFWGVFGTLRSLLPSEVVTTSSRRPRVRPDVPTE